MRNTLINIAIVILIILLPACASNKDATSVNNEHGINDQEEHSQPTSSTNQDKKISKSTSLDDDDSYRY